MPVHPLRRLAPHDRPVHPDRDYVLYWMTTARRTRYHFGLQHALDLARAHGKPLLVLEAIRAGYRWASERFQRFAVEGMADNARAFAAAGVHYYAYVEPTPGDGKGLLEALAARAVAVVADHYPCGFFPRMVAAASDRLDVQLEAIDANGVYPVAHADRTFKTAASFRRHLQKTLLPFLEDRPEEEPLRGYDLGMAELPDDVARRWPHAERWLTDPARVSELGLPSPGPVSLQGGAVEGGRVLDRFVAQRLDGYGERNHPDREVASGLSPWLHWGHVAAWEVIDRVLTREDFHPGQLGKVTGSREGWWGLSEAAEGFLDEIVTWRELGYVFTHRNPDYDRFEALPEWARKTLADHAADPRDELYDDAALAEARTGDPIWNAAQRELVHTGVMHNYLRMLWGKKVLQWSATPAQAFARLVDLNNRYALDGRDPNSYSGIAWVFGRFDRAWGPERPIFGKVRYMTSDSTRRKLKLKAYLQRFGDDGLLAAK
ncbi:MAG: FAD-binding domain-containing protein [Myxococcota bacterium]